MEHGSRGPDDQGVFRIWGLMEWVGPGWGFDGTGAKFSYWGGWGIRRAGFWGRFFDRATIYDRGLNVQSSVLYLASVHDAEVSYLAAADFGGQRWVTKGACGLLLMATGGRRWVGFGVAGDRPFDWAPARGGQAGQARGTSGLRIAVGGGRSKGEEAAGGECAAVTAHREWASQVSAPQRHLWMRR